MPNRESSGTVRDRHAGSTLLLDPAEQAMTRIGLALGGGGARGLAHIYVLRLADVPVAAFCAFWNVREFGPLSYAERVPVPSSVSRTRPV